MKTEFFKSAVLEVKQRGAVACLLLFFLISFEFTSMAVQLSNQKRITAMEIGSAAEGARVTIVSDSPLSDYEAFRRGDRFYVRIPSAQFASPMPRLRAEGFEDIQGERVGDSIIVSFKLQPGASARVDQRSNHLDVVFSAPGRNLLNPVYGSLNRATTGANDPQISLDRAASTAEPLPLGSAGVFREGAVTRNSHSGNGGRALPNSWSPNNVPSKANGMLTTKVAGNSASPEASPSSILPSAAYSPLTTVTPTVPASSQTAVDSSAADGSLNWKSRGKAALQWISVNRLATFPGALILLSLILYRTVLLARGIGERPSEVRCAEGPTKDPT